MPVDSIHDHEAARQIIELRSEISSLRIQVHALEHALDRKLDRYGPEFRKLDIELRSDISSLQTQVHSFEHALDRKLDRYGPEFRKLDLAVFSLRWWCAYLTAFLVAGAVAIIVVASKLP